MLIDFYIHSITTIEEAIQCETRPILLIQIVDAPYMLPLIQQDNIIHTCAFLCDDIERVEIKDTNPFNHKLAKKVINAWDVNKDKIEAVYCHCLMGISRSAATIAALKLSYTGDDIDIWNQYPRYDPNFLIYKLLLKELGFANYEELLGTRVLHRNINIGE